MYTLICLQCKKEFNLEKIYRNGRTTCSSICRTKLRQQTNLEKYGSTNVSQVASIKEKKRSSFLNHYGSSHYFQTQEFKDRKEDLMIDRYGVDHQSKSEEIKQKKKGTMLLKYGVENPSQFCKFQEKKIQTSLEKYGVPHPSLTEEFQLKTIKTNLERYGVPYSLQAISVQEKSKETLIRKYGNPAPNGSHITSGNYELLYDSNFLIKENELSSVNEIATALGVTPRTVYLRFKEFNIIPKKFNESLPEKEIAQFLDSKNIEFSQHTRQVIPPYELDFFIPSLNLAIEHNGTYWHTELSGNKDKNYHLNKTLECNKKNIHLLHIRGDEWVFKKSIIESIICSLIHLSGRIYARQCVVYPIDRKIYGEFLNTNHLQGYVSASTMLGLYYNNTLVSVMSFGKNRFKKNSIELLRFCNKCGVSVVGAASKLFSHYIKNNHIDSIVSYSHKDKFTGEMYKHLGFIYSHSSAQSYYYTRDYVNFENRLKYQKHKLEKILPIFDANLSEWQNMQNNGYDRIWDCGNDVWEWNKSDK